ncbi:uncharacterized protein LOC132201766 [Neocloeon triangulifer]|uniref:uncharacterized protein LOC132201766 n=1 Tax=Neocloeon triangulifer TaxID=2078957 RepID=UPI00286ECCDB|nr:uncharacterized protein LOC132201766 [Neocloeon triangulifer]
METRKNQEFSVRLDENIFTDIVRLCKMTNPENRKFTVVGDLLSSQSVPPKSHDPPRRSGRAGLGPRGPSGFALPTSAAPSDSGTTAALQDYNVSSTTKRGRNVRQQRKSDRMQVIVEELESHQEEEIEDSSMVSTIATTFKRSKKVAEKQIEEEVASQQEEDSDDSERIQEEVQTETGEESIPSQEQSADKSKLDDTIIASGTKFVDDVEEQDEDEQQLKRERTYSNSSSSSLSMKRKLPTTSHRGLRNSGFMCYMLASLQALVAAQPFCDLLATAEVHLNEDKQIYHLTHLSSEIQAPYASETEKVDEDITFLEEYAELRYKLDRSHQQDAHEYIIKMLGQVQVKLKHLRDVDIYEALLRIKTVMLPCYCEGMCKRNVTPNDNAVEEIVLSLCLPDSADDHKTVQDLIDASLQTEFVDRCCGKSTAAYYVFSELPRVLLVCLKRYDAEGGKIKTPIEVSTDLVLAEYSDIEDSRDQMKTNEDSKNVDKIANFTNKTYELVGVVNHEGSTIRRGHYTALVWNGTEGAWVEANDKKTKVVEMSNAIVGSSKTCYLLVYVLTREDERQEYAESSSESSGDEMSYESD